MKNDIVCETKEQKRLNNQRIDAKNELKKIQDEISSIQPKLDKLQHREQEVIIEIDYLLRKIDDEKPIRGLSSLFSDQGV